MEEDIFQKGKRAALIAGSTTVFFAAAKATVGFVSGSVVLLADAIHSAADSLSTFLAWFGLKIAQKKPTEKFPYGFYKVENVTSLVISGLILFAGIEIIEKSINKIFVLGQLNIPFIAVGVALLDATIMFFIGTYEVGIGRRVNSQSLIADGKESRTHLFSSSIVLIGLISTWFRIPYLEGIAGILISFLIFKIAAESGKESIFALIDVSPSREIEEKVKVALKKISGIRGFENLKLRKAGPFIFGEVRVKIGKAINVKRTNEISANIEKTIKKEVKNIDSFAISFEPFETQRQTICVPVEEDKGLDSKISSYFGRAPLFIFLKTERGKVKNFYVKENPYQEKAVRGGLQASEFISKEKVDSVITKEIGPISFHTLRDHIVDVYRTRDETVKKAIQNYSQMKLNLFEGPTKVRT